MKIDEFLSMEHELLSIVVAVLKSSFSLIFELQFPLSDIAKDNELGEPVSTWDWQGGYAPSTYLAE